jgi:hypothetical protein
MAPLSGGLYGGAPPRRKISGDFFEKKNSAKFLDASKRQDGQPGRPAGGCIAIARVLGINYYYYYWFVCLVFITIITSAQIR